MGGDKLHEVECDGVHHRWSYDRPIRCKGCGHRLNDLSDLKRRTQPPGDTNA